MVDNRKSCGYFDDEGNDNGVTSVIENHFDYHNTFTGGYDFGDISFKFGLKIEIIHHLWLYKTCLKGTCNGECRAQHVLEKVEKLCR